MPHSENQRVPRALMRGHCDKMYVCVCVYIYIYIYIYINVYCVHGVCTDMYHRAMQGPQRLLHKENMSS